MIISIIVMINMIMMIVNIITMVSNMRNMIMVWWWSFDQLIIIIVNIMVMINWSWWSSKSSWWSVIGGLWSWLGYDHLTRWSWWSSISWRWYENNDYGDDQWRCSIDNWPSDHEDDQTVNWTPKTSGNVSMIRCRWYNWLNKKASWKILNLKMKSIEN